MLLLWPPYEIPSLPLFTPLLTPWTTSKASLGRASAQLCCHGCCSQQECLLCSSVQHGQSYCQMLPSFSIRLPFISSSSVCAGVMYWEHDFLNGATSSQSDNLVRRTDSTWINILLPAAKANAAKVVDLPPVQGCVPGQASFSCSMFAPLSNRGCACLVSLFVCTACLRWQEAIMFLSM